MAAIESTMIAHQCETNVLADGWAVVTKDRSLTAPFGAHGGHDGQQLYKVLSVMACGHGRLSTRVRCGKDIGAKKF